MFPATSASRPVAQYCSNSPEGREEDRPFFKIIGNELDFGTAQFSEFCQFIDYINLFFKDDWC
jgi:hypothetical protein